MIDRPRVYPGDVAAFAIAVGGVALLFVPGVITDTTPMLNQTRPAIGVMLGLTGFGAGLWAGYRISNLNLPRVASNRIGRWSLRIMIPLWLSVGLFSIGQRGVEAFSFGAGSVHTDVTVPVVAKEARHPRRGRTIYEVTVANPVRDATLTLRVDRPVFDEVEPLRECVTLQIERSPSGAARLLAPLRWKVRCPGPNAG